jgi:hypothetical protein
VLHPLLAGLDISDKIDELLRAIEDGAAPVKAIMSLSYSEQGAKELLLTNTQFRDAVNSARARCARDREIAVAQTRPETWLSKQVRRDDPTGDPGWGEAKLQVESVVAIAQLPGMDAEAREQAELLSKLSDEEFAKISAHQQVVGQVLLAAKNRRADEQDV